MREYRADIVVISAGTAGLAAAITAAESGMSVIAVEKNGSCGGNGNLAMGPFAVESRLQRLMQHMLTREEAYRIHMDFTQWGVNARLVKQFIDMSSDTISWLEGMGVEFSGLGAHGPGMNHTWHLIKPAPGDAEARKNSGYLAIGAMRKRAEELGVQIMLKTTAERLMVEAGRVTGVEARDADGQMTVRAGAVISAAGGYGAYWRAPMGIPLGGDGLRMAREVGADVTDGTMLIPDMSGKRPDGGAITAGSVLRRAFEQPNLFVNLQGERFMDEEVSVLNPLGANSIMLQKDHVFFSILDDAIKDIYAKNGFDFMQGYGTLAMGTPIENAAGFEEEMKRVVDMGPGEYFVAGNIEELARCIGLDPIRLKKTVTEYNLACETGRDDAFGKNARFLRSISKPPFFAQKSMGGVFVGSPEGILINYRMEALTPEFMTIPGLYAAGNDACRNIWRDMYVNVLPGNAFGWALNSGRMAAENAVDYISSQA